MVIGRFVNAVQQKELFTFSLTPCGCVKICLIIGNNYTMATENEEKPRQFHEMELDDRILKVEREHFLFIFKKMRILGHSKVRLANADIDPREDHSTCLGRKRRAGKG